MLTYVEALNKIKSEYKGYIVTASIEYDDSYGFWLAEPGYDEPGLMGNMSEYEVDKETGKIESSSMYSVLAMFLPEKLEEAKKTYKIFV